MSGEWKEVQERTVNFPEDDPETFETYIHLLYTGRLAVRPDPVPDKYKGESEQLFLSKLYVLAEKLQDNKTKNVSLKALMICIRETRSDGCCYLPEVATICTIYGGTTTRSMARKVLVGQFSLWAGHTLGEEFLKTARLYPVKFIYDLLGSVLITRPRLGKELAFSDYEEKNFIKKRKFRSSVICAYIEGRLKALSTWMVVHNSFRRRS